MDLGQPFRMIFGKAERLSFALHSIMTQYRFMMLLFALVSFQKTPEKTAERKKCLSFPAIYVKLTDV